MARLRTSTIVSLASRVTPPRVGLASDVTSRSPQRSTDGVQAPARGIDMANRRRDASALFTADRCQVDPETEMSALLNFYMSRPTTPATDRATESSRRVVYGRQDRRPRLSPRRPSQGAGIARGVHIAEGRHRSRCKGARVLSADSGTCRCVESIFLSLQIGVHVPIDDDQLWPRKVGPEDHSSERRVKLFPRLQ